eukprot:sb/3472822/
MQSIATVFTILNDIDPELKNKCIMFHNAMFPRQPFISNMKAGQTFRIIYIYITQTRVLHLVCISLEISKPLCLFAKGIRMKAFGLHPEKIPSDPYLVTPYLVTPLFSDTIFFPQQKFDKIFIKISKFLFSLPAVWKRDLMSFLSFPLSHSPYQDRLSRDY